MARNLTDGSESPVRDRGGLSPQRKSVSAKIRFRRESSPVQHRSSNRDGSSPVRAREKHSSRGKSPKHAQSRSPSPRTRRLMRARDEREVEKVKERENERDRGRRSNKGINREKPRSPVSLSPSPRSKRMMRFRDEREADKVTEREPERNHGRGSDKVAHRERSLSPISRFPSPRTKQLGRAQAERDGDKVTEKEHERNHGRTREKETNSLASRSPSPRTKRLRRAQAERDGDKVTEKEHERNRGRTREKEANPPASRSPSPRTKRFMRAQAEKEAEREHEKNRGRGSDKGTHRERDHKPESDRKERRGSDRDIEDERKDKRLGIDEVNNNSSRTRHEQSASPLDQPHRSRHRSHLPQSADGARTRHEVTNSRGAECRDDDDDDAVAKMKAAAEALELKEKQKPSFELSGKLAAETNRFRGVTLLFNEPPEARKPDVRWRLYVFKAGEVLNEPLYIHRQSCYLFGRERRVADIPTDHPSCSKQHAIIQFRQVEKEKPDGTLSRQVRPYLMDLGSTNKTYLNEDPIEPQRYYELFEKDTIKFGNSSREYVVLHENSTG